jgi:hypothetical protein
LKGFELESMGSEGLIVKNPPTVRVTNDEELTDSDLKGLVE